MTLFELLGIIAIDNTEAMKKMDETVDAAKKLGDGMEEAGEEAEELGGKINDAGNEADKASNKMGENSKIGAAAVWLGNTLDRVGAAAFNFIKKGIVEGYEYNKMMEGYLTSFSVMIGSEEKAHALLDDLWMLAADTPMEMSGLAKNAETLLNYGVAAETLIPTLLKLGNASKGNQTNLDRMTRAYGQIFGFGYLKAEETNQMIEAGFPLLEYLEKSMGKNIEEILTLREDGAILFADVQAAIDYATKEGERYYNSMEAYSKTTEGKEARFHDELNQTLGKLMEPFTEEYSNTVLGKLSEIVNSVDSWADDNNESLKSWANGLSTAFDLVSESAEPLAAYLMTILDTLSLITGNEVDTSKYRQFTPHGKLAELAMKPTMPGQYATAEEIEKWFDELDPELKKELDLDMPGPDATAKEIEAWWAGVQPTLTATFAVIPGGSSTFTSEKGTVFGGNGGTVIGDMHAYHLQVTSGQIVPDGSHASGLDYVPKDNYLARLHLGETVLNKEAAAAWRQQQKGGGTAHLEGVVAELASAIQDLREGIGMNLYVNKRHVASAMSRDMGKSIGNREYTLMKGMGG